MNRDGYGSALRRSTDASRFERASLAAWRALGCRDAGRVDLRCDGAGEPQFMEVNPLAGLHPTHSDLPILAAAAGIPYERLMGHILRLGLQRAGLLRVPVGSLVVVTKGADGAAIYRDGEKLVSVPGFSVKVVETTGCGDAFMGAILAQLAGKTAKEIASMTPEQLQPIARFANAAAAIVAARYGAADANPTSTPCR